jgi:hypothetical protein
VLFDFLALYIKWLPAFVFVSWVKPQNRLVRSHFTDLDGHTPSVLCEVDYVEDRKDWTPQLGTRAIPSSLSVTLPTVLATFLGKQHISSFQSLHIHWTRLSPWQWRQHFPPKRRIKLIVQVWQSIRLSCELLLQRNQIPYTVELGYNVMKGTEYFVSL